MAQTMKIRAYRRDKSPRLSEALWETIRRCRETWQPIIAKTSSAMVPRKGWRIRQVEFTLEKISKTQKLEVHLTGCLSHIRHL
jgi:hypothetical protein